MSEAFKPTKILYSSNSTVTLNMSISQYRELLTGYNDFKWAVESLVESHDLFISDLRKLESFKMDLFTNLGFCKLTDENGKENHWGPAVLSSDPNAWIDEDEGEADE